MDGSITQSPAWAAGLGLLCGIVGFRLGWRGGSRWGLPLVQAALGSAAFLAAWNAAGPARAALAVLAWAVGGSLASIPAFRRDPARTDRVVLRAVPYRAEMHAWLATGRGPESTPLATTGRHLAEFVVYVVAGLVSMNLLALAMGAALLNYMNAWVAALLRAAQRPVVVALLGWNVWSVVRVVAYVLVGVATAGPWASRTTLAVDADRLWPLAIAGGIGAVVDLGLKLALSRPCGRVLAGAVDVEALGAASGGSPDAPEAGP